MLTLEEAISKLNNKKKVNESLSQEISNSYKSLSDKYGVDLDKLVKEFMDVKYPGGFPDFKGDVIYSEKYWNEFEQWLKDEKGIELPHDEEPSFEELLGEDVNGVSLQDEKKAFERFIKDKGLDRIGKADVYVEKGEIKYDFVVEDSFKGSDLEDYLYEYGEYYFSGMEVDFDEDNLMEHIREIVWDKVYEVLDEDTDDFIVDENEITTSYENNVSSEISDEEYGQVYADVWGSFDYLITIPFTKR